MCGIAGFLLHEGQAHPDQVARMCARIVHRGPDDHGIHTDRWCGIGMRRLSIIDLGGGHQPIANEDQSIWVVFNGEIYNFSELRLELERRGHRFKTHSDTEAIVHLYEEEGVEGLNRLRGMFAFAIWDGRNERLVLARDRFGKKPLFYADLPNGLFFASELDALRAVPIPLEVDREALRLYFQFSWIPDPYTAFRHVKKLEAGSWLSVAPGRTTRRGRYWRLPPPNEERPATAEPPDSILEELRVRFDEAVRIRLMADVPLGAFLSGGIDSSSVVASMARQTREPVKTFSIGFREAAFNELAFARKVAEAYRTEHHELIVEPDSVHLATKIATHFGEPFGDSSAIPTYLVSEFASRHVKVALSGDGGDELFGGYDSFLAVERHRPLDDIPGVFRHAIERIASALPYSAYGKNYLRMVSRRTPAERYFENTYAPHFVLQQLLQTAWLPPADGAFLSAQLEPYLLPEPIDALSQAMYFEATAKLSGDMLTKVDRMSMAASLEVRCPMLDHELAEFAMQIPNAWKVRGGKGKDVLVRALGERLPSDLLNRPKMGFGVPLAVWFRGPLRDLLVGQLADGLCVSQEIVSPDFVKHLMDEHFRSRRDNCLWLWCLLMLELWLRDVTAPQAATAVVSC
ncbi:MAG: asparagine synthase (glutamine-hydrolyzing) [Vicinamibacterales bacterium]